MTLRINGLIQTTKRFQEEMGLICAGCQLGEEINFLNPEGAADSQKIN